MEVFMGGSANCRHSLAKHTTAAAAASNICSISHFRLRQIFAHFHISHCVKYLPVFTIQIASNICPFSQFRLRQIFAHFHNSDCVKYLPVFTIQIASNICPFFAIPIASNICPFSHFRLHKIFAHFHTSECLSNLPNQYFLILYCTNLLLVLHNLFSSFIIILKSVFLRLP